MLFGIKYNSKKMFTKLGDFRTINEGNVLSFFSF